VVEQAMKGIDTVRSLGDWYALPANVENFVLARWAALALVTASLTACSQKRPRQKLDGGQGSDYPDQAGGI
jgi:hypothetical protein